jgi:hypothetical protein
MGLSPTAVGGDRRSANDPEPGWLDPLLASGTLDGGGQGPLDAGARPITLPASLVRRADTIIDRNLGAAAGWSEIKCDDSQRAALARTLRPLSGEDVTKGTMGIGTLRVLHLVFCASALLPCAAQAQSVMSAPDALADRPLKVLFLGNSLTYCNNMPGSVATLALAAKSPRLVQVTQIAFPDATLEQLWSYRPTKFAVSETNWDFIVLQESPSRLIYQPDRALAAAREIDAAAKKVGAKIVLYLVWTRKSRLDVFDTLQQNSYALAREIGVQVALVGPAWAQMLKSEPATLLFGSDDFHPSGEETTPRSDDPPASIVDPSSRVRCLPSCSMTKASWFHAARRSS